MDVRSVSVAGAATSGTEDEDSAEYVDGHEDSGELLDPLLDNAEEATKAKLKELDRLADLECMRHLHVALGKKRATTRWDLDRRKDGIRARFVARGFKGDETMYDVFAPNSTPEHRTRHRQLEPQEVVSHIHSRRDQCELPRGRGRRMLRGPTG